MSSILDALRQLESSGAPPAPVASAGAERANRLPIVMAGLAFAFVAGVGIALVFRHDRQAAPSAPARTAAVSSPRAPIVTPVAEALPAAPAVPAPLVLDDVEAPWARVTSPDAPAASSPPVRERPMPAVARTTEVEPRVAALARPPRAAAEPHVRLAALDYSSSPNYRTAALIVNGGSPVTLREGESTRDVQVTLILPDRVYVRRAGQVFAFHPGE
jgi:hypothetical protein